VPIADRQIGEAFWPTPGPRVRVFVRHESKRPLLTLRHGPSRARAEASISRAHAGRTIASIPCSRPERDRVGDPAMAPTTGRAVIATPRMRQARRLSGRAAGDRRIVRSPQPAAAKDDRRLAGARFPNGRIAERRRRPQRSSARPPKAAISEPTRLTAPGVARPPASAETDDCFARPGVAELTIGLATEEASTGPSAGDPYATGARAAWPDRLDCRRLLNCARATTASRRQTTGSSPGRSSPKDDRRSRLGCA
jgi:hypothetical protein